MFLACDTLLPSDQVLTGKEKETLDTSQIKVLKINVMHHTIVQMYKIYNKACIHV